MDLDTTKLNDAGFFALPDTIGTDAFRRFCSVLDFLEPFHRTDVPDPHWYAMVIGVDSNAQGRGLGSLLLSPILSRADENGVPVYLETCQPGNVRFYRKHGFQVTRSGSEPGSGLPYWTFLRAPGTPRLPDRR
jgi:ribosomal protein S18 acetylase RimI-like enzyme